MDDTRAAVRVFAPAKINLTLHVRGQRADGYHLLDSLVVFAGVGDEVAARRADGLALTVTGPFAAALSDGGGENLVLRAARLLAAAGGGGRPRGAEIALEKNLPVASGIGGGSSDAVAALTACARLWDDDLARLAGADLTDARLAANLGADVPVCLRRRPTFMRGIGEDLVPAAALPPAWFVLANPGRPLATKAVFQALGGRFSAPPPAEAFAGLRDAAALAAALRTGGNDLAAPAAALMPEIPAMLEQLAATPGCLLARMSGSGPTCFGLYGSASAAADAAARLAAARPGWWVAPAPLLHPPL